MIVSRKETAAGKIRIAWRTATGDVFMYKFDKEPTEAKLEALAAESKDIKDADKGKLQVNGLINEAVFDFLARLRIAPISQPQYSALLGALPWQEATNIRSLVSSLSDRLGGTYPTEISAVQAIRTVLQSKTEKFIQLALKST